MQVHTSPVLDDLETLAATAVNFSRAHAALLSPFSDKPGPPDLVLDLADHALEALAHTLEALAARAARTHAQRRAKALALRECFVGGCVEGDCGLALSLVQDILDADD